MTLQPSIAIIGLGEVGTIFAEALIARGLVVTAGSRPSTRAAASAQQLGLALDHDLARATTGADIVLLTITGDGLRDVVATIAPALAPNALLADLTAAAPSDVIAAADSLMSARSRYVDVAIMGAVSLNGLKVPLLASGDSASSLAASLNGIGFAVATQDGLSVGDASRLKLLRSLFAKGLDAIIAESMLAAEALGLRHALVNLLGDFDNCPLRDHIDMYLRTHTQHAARRRVEMELSEGLLREIDLPSLTTRATIERYRRTAQLVSASDTPPTSHDADAAIGWLLTAERQSS